MYQVKFVPAGQSYGSLAWSPSLKWSQVKATIVGVNSLRGQVDQGGIVQMSCPGLGDFFIRKAA